MIRSFFNTTLCAVTAAGALALSSTTPVSAATVSLNLKIYQIRVLDDVDGPFDNTAEVFARGNLAGKGFVTSQVKNKEDTIARPNWNIAAEVDAQSLPGYSADGWFVMFDADAITREDRLDATPGAGEAVVVSHDLRNGRTPTSGYSKGRGDDRIEVWWTLTSDPLVYRPDLRLDYSIVNDAYLLDYDLRNSASSHYAISEIFIPSVGLFGLDVAPGEGNRFVTAASTKSYRLASRVATVTYNDPARTRATQIITVPVPIPLPAGGLLLVIGLSVLAAVRKRRRNRPV